MPTPSKSVQFRSAEQVLEAYESRNVAAFAIWQGKQFLFKYEGDSLEEGAGLLSKWVEMLESNESSAIYTVCVYEELPANGKIKDNTPYDGSFNFRLQNTPSGYLPPQQYVNYQQHGGNLKVLLDKLQAQQTQIEHLQQQLNEPEEEEENSLGMVGKLLEHPVLGPVISPLLEKLANGIAEKIVGNDEPAANLRRVSGIGDSEADQRILNALQQLEKNVTDLPAVLEKLALLSEKRPAQFRLYLGMLTSMKL